MHLTKNMRVKVNKEAWSEKSKQSLEYELVGEYYSDIKYRCWKCAKKAKFTAEDQKKSFEVQKNYVWQRRVLCNDCHNELLVVKNDIKKYEQLWGKETQESKPNAKYLKAWLAAINEMPKYGKPKNDAMANMLTKIINKNA